MRAGILSLVLASAATLIPVAAQAVSQNYQLNIPCEPLDAALKDLAQQTTIRIVRLSNTPVGSAFTGPVSGNMQITEALKTLLGPSQLTYRLVNNHTIAVMTMSDSLTATSLPDELVLLQSNSSQDTNTQRQEEKNNSFQPFRVVQVGQGQASRDNSRERQNQDRSTDASSALAEIIVTATKRAERLQDLPMSITALSGGELARRGDSDINDVVANTPGLYNPAQGLGILNNLIIRGVASGAATSDAQTTVSFMLDEIDLNPGAVTFGNANPRIIDVQQVEVLRGPQGTLFGAGSLSGAVRFISNKPDLESFSGSVEATGSSTDHGGNSGEVSGILNAPIIEGKFAARVVAYSYNDSGWVDNPSRGLANVNSSHTDGGRLLLNVQPVDEVSMLLTAMDDRTHEPGSSGTFYYPQPGLTNSQYQQPQYGIGSSLTDTHIYNLLTTWQPTWGTLTSTTSYYDRALIRTTDFGPLLPLLGLASASDNPAAPSVTRNTIHDVSQELRIESPQVGGLRFTAGAYYQRLSSDPSQIITSFLPVAPVLLDGAVTTVQWQAALFGSATYTFADRFDFTAGVRVSKDVVHFTTLESGLLASVNTVGNEVDNPVTPRAALTFRQTNDLTWYLQVAKGYRVGGPNITAGNHEALASYGPDSLWNYEVGNKVRLLNGKLDLNSSLYDIEWNDMQVGLVTPQGFDYIGNGGKARIYGIEEELTLRPVPWLELGGTVSADHAATTAAAAISRGSFGAFGPAPNFEPNAATQNGVLAGYRLPGSPELQGSLYEETQFHILDHEAYIRISAQYIGSAYTDFNAQGLKFGDFATGNARAGAKFQHFEIIGFVNNFTNSNGATSAADLSQFNVPTAYRVRPRTVGLTLRAGF